MSEKRRDSKGRILRNSECQRKDGMYQYDYIDITGKTKCVYSWKRESTDPLPKGKRKCVSLRDKEREIQKCECFKRIIANRKKLKTEPMVAFRGL